MLLAIRRRASSLPRLCGRSTSMGCDIAATMGGRSALFKLQRGTMLGIMRRALAALIFLAAPGAAQTPAPVPAVPPAVWDPAAPYITIGQDEPGYRSWYLAAPWRAAQVRQFNDYLTTSQVSGIVPTWQLFRTATAWKDCGGQPFEIPPTSEWPHILQ